MLPLRSCVRFVFVLALLIPATAFAQMRICVYTIEDWVQDVDEIQANLIVPEEETPNFKEAGILIEVMDREWECLVRPVPPEEILRYAQIRAYVSFHSGDPDEALRWNRAAQYMDPSAAFPDWVPEWHPLREQLEWEDPTEITTSEGKHIAHPKKGGVFMNGRFLTAATAPEEVPTLVQVYDKKGARVDIHWQQGSYFKPALVTEEAVVAKAPKWFIPPAPLSGPAVAAADVEEEAVMEEAPPVEEEEPVAEEPEEAPVVVEEEPEEEEPAAEEPAEEAPPEEEVTEEEPAPEPEEAETAEVPPEAVEEEPAEEAVAEAEPAAPAEVTTVAAGAAFAALVGTSDACPEKTTLAALQEATAKGVTAYVDNDKSGLDKAWTAAKESASCLRGRPRSGFRRARGGRAGGWRAERPEHRGPRLDADLLRLFRGPRGHPDVGRRNGVHRASGRLTIAHPGGHPRRRPMVRVGDDRDAPGLDVHGRLRLRANALPAPKVNSRRTPNQQGRSPRRRRSRRPLLPGSTR